MGLNHVSRGGDRGGDSDLTSMIEKRAHYSTCVIALTGAQPESDAALRGTAPSFYPLHGTRLGQQKYFDRRFEDAAYAFLYLGHCGDAVSPDWNALQNDKVYFPELQRRHLIEFGCPLNLETWKRMSRPCS